MPIELRHDVDPALQAIAAFILNRQLRQGGAQPNAPGAATPTASPLDALQAIAQQQAMQAPSLGPASPIPPRATPAAVDAGGMDPRLALQKYEIDQQAATQRAIAGSNFLQHSFDQSAGVMNQMMLAEHEAGLQARQIAQQQQFTAGEHQKAFEQQQLLGEMNANLDAVGRVQTTAPAMLDVDQVREAARRIQANREALTEPERYARQQLMDKIATGDPAAMQEGLRQGLLYWSPEQETIIRKTKEEMQKISQDPRYTPAERARALAILGQRLNSMRPMETPTNKVPLSPIEEFHQNTVEYPNPSGGPAYLYHKTYRDGHMQLTPDQNRAEAIKAWEEKQMKLWEKEHGIDQKTNPAEFQQKMIFGRQEQASKMYAMANKNRIEVQKQYDQMVADSASALTDYQKKKDDQTNDPAEDSAALEAYRQAESIRAQAELRLRQYDQWMDHWATEFNRAYDEGERLKQEQSGGSTPLPGQPPGQPGTPPQGAPVPPQPGATQQPPMAPPAAPVAPPTPPQQPQPPQPQPQSTPQAPKIQVNSKQDLMKALLTGQVNEGDWVMTSRGPMQMTQEAMNRLLASPQ